ncbi:hypothetical protein [Halomonas nitroreducens]|uniref:Tip attachment protein J domain-containing protein n=1 Tax=Halomonas nitroreducens TaxID=447425 RepID=A0A3S0HNX3_9GAMM|nr:hypothetical protein [Halomonas nitroreducens]RTR01935.1 hypothetical protein EKG36_13075 [Halomonas nitroreducens]
MTDADYAAWLADHAAPRVVLCEMEHGAGTEFLASHPYISRPTDAVPNRVYDDLLAEAIDIETRADARLSFGEVRLVNDGALDAWLGYAWTGHAIRLYLGGPGWSRDDFRLHARGINQGISGARRGELVFSMVDQSARLDEPLDTGTLPLGGGPVPLALGSVYNAPAYRVSTTALTYRASYLAATALTPKELGNTVPHTDDLAGGAFTLDNAPGGALTVDIQQADDTPAEVVAWVAAQYGLTVAENGLSGYTVGLYYAGPVSGRQILDDLCRGQGGYWYLDALGQLVVRQHQVPTVAELTLAPDDVLFGSLELVETQQPWASLTLRWGRNAAPLREVAGTIEANDASEAERLKREWRESVATQALPDYPLAEEVTRASPLSVAADAATERDRLLALRAVRRDVWRLEAFLPEADVGQAIAVEVGALSGRLGRVIAVRRSPTRGITTLEVWV